MKRFTQQIRRASICVTTLLVATNSSLAATIFESGTLGPTAVAWVDLQNGTVPSTSIHSLEFPGVRFELSQPAAISEVGGHFVGPNTGTFFGAVVKLDNGSDFPNSNVLSTPDVLGTTTLTFPTNNSSEIFGKLSITLDPGWYALVFGSGLFNTTGYGAAVRNGIDINDPSYIAHDPNFGWFDLELFGNSFDNHRFVVRGMLIPEANAILLVILASVTFVPFRYR